MSGTHDILFVYCLSILSTFVMLLVTYHFWYTVHTVVFSVRVALYQSLNSLNPHAE